MKVGLVCPYPWDVPGGVMAHVRDMAEQLIARGHQVSVLAPVNDSSAALPDYLVDAGHAVPIPFNGSTARLLFGPVSAARARRWLEADGDGFDVVHLHAPESISLSLLVLLQSDQTTPLVATFHQHNEGSRRLRTVAPAMRTQLEKIRASIAVSEAAASTATEHGLTTGSVLVIPNGVDVASFAGADPLPGYPRRGGSIGFIGRLDEPRKGLRHLVDAFRLLAHDMPDLELLVAGPGEGRALDDLSSDLAHRVRLLGRISDHDKARFYRSVDVYAAPNTRGESFGIVLLESMAAGTPVVASDLDAFAAVLDDGAAGELVAREDPAALAAGLARVLTDPDRAASLVDAGRATVQRYDWSVIVDEVLAVYDVAIRQGVSQTSSGRLDGDGDTLWEIVTDWFALGRRGDRDERGPTR